MDGYSHTRHTLVPWRHRALRLCDKPQMVVYVYSYLARNEWRYIEYAVTVVCTAMRMYARRNETR